MSRILVGYDGSDGAEIVEVARRVQAKTIVLGEHHHGFLAKLFGGDVAAGVQREARLHRDPRPSG